MVTFGNVAAFLLFTLECFNVCGHLNVYFRFRLLPRKDLVRIQFYFLFELLTVFLSSFLYLQRLQWLTALQNVQHLYYFMNWEKTDHAKKIVSWSSLDWTIKVWYFDIILGTTFDVTVHVLMAFFLGQHLSRVQIIISLFLVPSSLLVVICGPWFAWSSTSAIPKWVNKRICPLSKEQCNLGKEK